MVVKVLYYVFSLFAVVVLFLLMQEPYFLDLEKSDSKLAKIEIANMRDYEMNEDMIFRVFHAKKATRFEDKDVLEDVFMSFLREDLIYDIKSHYATYEGDLVILDKNVEAKRSDGISFYTKSLSYNIKEKTFSSSEDFVLDGKFLHVSGIGLSYDMSKKKMTANGVRATYELEKE